MSEPSTTVTAARVVSMAAAASCRSAGPPRRRPASLPRCRVTRRAKTTSEPIAPAPVIAASNGPGV